MAQLGIESVLVAGRGPAACAVIAACSRLEVKAVAVHSETERHALHVRLADDAVLLGPAPASESYLAVDRIVEAARRSGVSAVLPVPPALAGNARLAGAVVASGLTWVGPEAAVLERLGGDGVEPASEQGLLAWVTDDGLRCVTPVTRDRAAGIARVSWTPAQPQPPLPAPPAGWSRWAGGDWSPSAWPRTASWPRWPPASPSTWRCWNGPTVSTPSSWRCAVPRARGRGCRPGGAGAGRRRRPAPLHAPAGTGRAGHRTPARSRPAARRGRVGGGGGDPRLRAGGPARRLVRRAAGHGQRGRRRRRRPRRAR